MFLNSDFGNLHNLFGNTHAVHVSLGEEGYKIRHVIKGDRVTDVLVTTEQRYFR